jgi:hypothetical protein
MRGYVLVYRPTTGAGVVVTEAGETLAFSAAARGVDLHGGDWVRFRLAEAATDRLARGGSRVRDLELVQNGADRLSATQAPLLAALSRTVEMEPVH